MKKIISTILALVCVLGLTACGSAKEEDFSAFSDQAVNAYYMIANSEEVIGGDLRDISADFQDRDWAYLADYFNNYGFYVKNGFVLKDAMVNYWNIIDEQGSATLSGDINDYKNWPVEYTNGTYNVTVPMIAGDRTASMEITMKEDQTITGIVINIDYTFGEKMAKAGLNTLLGMGTVFVVLVFIIFVISLFGIIPKLQNRNKKKDIGTTAAENTIAQIEKREEQEAQEDLSDDLELVAVISAAIAAYEGSASADGFVVRSIKKRR